MCHNLNVNCMNGHNLQLSCSPQFGDRGDGTELMWPPSGKCRMSRSSKPGSCCFICTNLYCAPPSSKITACCPLVKYVHHLARQSDTENSFVWASVLYHTVIQSSCLEYGMKKEVQLPWSTNAESAQDCKVEWVNASAHNHFFFF